MAYLNCFAIVSKTDNPYACVINAKSFMTRGGILHNKKARSGLGMVVVVVDGGDGALVTDGVVRGLATDSHNRSHVIRITAYNLIYGPLQLCGVALNRRISKDRETSSSVNKVLISFDLMKKLLIGTTCLQMVHRTPFKSGNVRSPSC